MATVDPSPNHCLKDDCRAKTRGQDCDMIRCIVCFIGHHAECISKPKDETNQVWTCFECRQLTKTVTELRNELSGMHAQQREMMTLLQDMCLKLTQERETRVVVESELCAVKTELSELVKKSENKTTQAPVQTDESPSVTPVTPSAPPLPSLLLGTSLLRNVDPNSLKDHEVIAKGGATVRELHEVLNRLPDTQHFDKLTIVAGSIDVESQTTDDIISEYLALTVTAADKSNKIEICSVLPRTDKALTGKINSLNEELEKVCADNGHTFLDMNDTFHLRNGKVNAACLLPDGLHLMKFGVDNLLQSCQVSLKDGVRSAFGETRYKKERTHERLLFRGHESPLSNFYPVEGLIVDGIPFATTEAAYVYRKAMFHGDRQTAETVKISQTGIHAKRLGDRIVTSPAWHQKKVDIMDNLVRIKLEVCSAARQVLRESRDKELVEDTPNAFWGRGSENNKGQNMLGQIWMMYRKKIDRMDLRGPRSRYRSWATRDSQPRCHRCGEHGHLLDQCCQRDDVECWNCGSQGHKRKHCHQFTARYELSC